MNKNIMKQAGFGEQVERFEQGRCTTCNKPINSDSFKNELSKKEYTISGMCQECQDKVFKRNKSRSTKPKRKICSYKKK